MRRTLLACLAGCLLLPTPATAGPSDPYRPLQWGLDRIEADRAGAVSSGAGVVVAVIDTGVDASHPDLAGRVRRGRDFVDDDDDASDRNGHGTLIAGIIAATTENGVGIAGVAPHVDILPVRVLDEDGTGVSTDVADGIDWAVKNGADVVNLSLAQDGSGGVLGNLLADPSVDRAIEDAAEAGATVVIAAGNSDRGGEDETAYDATVPGAVVVGATTKKDKRAAYSHYGQGLDLVAPGGGSAGDPADGACTEDNGIISTWWNPQSKQSSYGAGCGTSMSVAFVSGVAAMLHARGSTNTAIVQRILATADDLGTRGWDPQTGAGRLNAARALGAPASTGSTPTSEPRPSSTRRQSEPVVRSQSQQVPSASADARPVRRPTKPEPTTSSTTFPSPEASGSHAAFEPVVPSGAEGRAHRGWPVAGAGGLMIAVGVAHLTRYASWSRDGEQS